MLLSDLLCRPTFKDDHKSVILNLGGNDVGDNQNVSYELLCSGTSKSTPAWLVELTKDPFDFADAMGVLS